jgi:hypothetical protein
MYKAKFFVCSEIRKNTERKSSTHHVQFLIVENGGTYSNH